MPESSFRMERLYGKILLFGEYTILLKGNALAIPLQNNAYSGVLNLDIQTSQDPMWKDWLKYLLELRNSHLSDLVFDWEGLEKDIAEGLWFESTLPIGYGLGSSGALTAGVFRRYISDQQWLTLKSDLNNLQKTLALFESYFHGSSSGLDPLVSLFNAPIQVAESETLLLSELKLESCRNWFLIDSGLPRQTSHLVEIFRKKVNAELLFEEKMLELKSANNSAIDDFSNQNTEQLEFGIRQISTLQCEQMDWLIPENIKSYWTAGLETNKCFFKLCGAGGGGFFLAYIPKKADQMELSKRFGLMAIYPSE